MLAPLRRDDQKVAEAALEARKNTKEGDEKAMELLKKSQTEIEEIVYNRCLLLSSNSVANYIFRTQAALWGLHFEVICGECSIYITL